MMLTLSHCGFAEADTHVGQSKKAPKAAESNTGECGARGQPLCPTQAWMKATVQASLLARDLPQLEQFLTTIADRAPQGYPEWEAIARAGASAAKKEDMAGVRTSCKACHDSYRNEFRKRHRKLLIFEP